MSDNAPQASPAVQAAVRQMVLTVLLGETPFLAAAVVAYVVTSNVWLMAALIAPGFVVAWFAVLRFLGKVRAARNEPAATGDAAGPPIVQ